MDIKEIRDLLAKVDERLAEADPSWTATEDFHHALGDLKHSLRELEPPTEEQFDFELPSRIRVRGARTGVAVKSLKVPDGWRGHIRWRWYIDGALVHKYDSGRDDPTASGTAYLDTSGLPAGDHNLKVEADFIERVVEQRVPIHRLTRALDISDDALKGWQARTNVELLDAAADPAQFDEIRGSLEELDFRRLMAVCDLSRVMGLHPADAVTLARKGIATVDMLEKWDPAKLYDEYLDNNPGAVPGSADEERRLLDRVTTWINNAHELEASDADD